MLNLNPLVLFPLAIMLPNLNQNLLSDLKISYPQSNGQIDERANALTDKRTRLKISPSPHGAEGKTWVKHVLESFIFEMWF